MAGSDLARAAVAASNADAFARPDRQPRAAAELKRALAIETLLGQASGALCVTNPRYRRAALAIAPPQTKGDGLTIRCSARRGAAAASRAAYWPPHRSSAIAVPCQ